HWHAASGSGPVVVGTLKRLAHAVVSLVVDGVALARVSDLGTVGTFRTRSGATPNAESGATASTAPRARSVVVKDGSDATTVAIPILLTATTRPPALATAAMPAPAWPCFNTTMYRATEAVRDDAGAAPANGSASIATPAHAIVHRKVLLILSPLCQTSRATGGAVSGGRV